MSSLQSQLLGHAQQLNYELEEDDQRLSRINHALEGERGGGEGEGGGEGSFDVAGSVEEGMEEDGVCERRSPKTEGGASSRR